MALKVIMTPSSSAPESAVLYRPHSWPNAEQKVLVLERHYTAGGYTHTFKRKGFEWDVGVHYIGDVMHPKNELRKVFDDVSDGKLQWADMGDVYDTIVIGGDRYDLVKGRENLRKQLKSYFPGEEEAIDAYIQLVRETVFGAILLHGKGASPTPRQIGWTITKTQSDESCREDYRGGSRWFDLQYAPPSRPSWSVRRLWTSAKRCELLHSRYGRKTLL